MVHLATTKEHRRRLSLHANRIYFRGRNYSSPLLALAAPDAPEAAATANHESHGDQSGDAADAHRIVVIAVVAQLLDLELAGDLGDAWVLPPVLGQGAVLERKPLVPLKAVAGRLSHQQLIARPEGDAGVGDAHVAAHGQVHGQQQLPVDGAIGQGQPDASVTDVACVGGSVWLDVGIFFFGGVGGIKKFKNALLGAQNLKVQQ